MLCQLRTVATESLDIIENPEGNVVTLKENVRLSALRLSDHIPSAENRDIIQRSGAQFLMGAMRIRMP